MTRVRRPRDRRGATTPPRSPDAHLVCGDGDRTSTIIVVATRQTRQPGRRTATATTRARSSTARSARASCRWRSTGSGSARRPPPPRSGDLQALVADLQTANAPVQLPDLKKPLAGRAAAAGACAPRSPAVLVLLGIAIGWGLYGNTSSPLSFTTDPGAKADGIPAKVLTPPRQLQSLGGLTGLFEQMRQKFGDTMGYELTIYPDYASLDRAGSEREPPAAELHLPRRLGRPDRVGQGRRRQAGRPGAVRRRRRSSACCAARRRPSASSPTTSSSTYLSIDPTCDPTHPRRAEHRDLRHQRLRQRLHRAHRRRHRQADQLPELTLDRQRVVHSRAKRCGRRCSAEYIGAILLARGVEPS